MEYKEYKENMEKNIENMENNMEYKEYKIILNIYIRSNSAEAVPPLGTTLGNIGVNALKFCKEFNEFTKDLPNYFFIKS